MARTYVKTQLQAQARSRTSKDSLGAVMESLAVLEDPRRKQGLRYPLRTVFLVTLLATVCGCDDAEAIEEWGEHARPWLESVVDMPHGPPSQDVILNVFARLDPSQTQDVFQTWLLFLKESLASVGKHIAIDGKTSRGSRNGKTAATHVVSAWASETSMVVGQVHVKNKSNEIKEIPELLDALDLHGAFVTADAIACQKEITDRIVDGGGHYLIAVGANQPSLHQGIKETFADASRTVRPADQSPAPATIVFQETSGGHGRIEHRRTSITSDLRFLQDKEKWSHICRLIQVERTREVLETQKKTTSVSYYITSAETDDAQLIHRTIQAHWTVENGLHWVLDVAFNEDRVRARSKNAAANFAVVRHIAIDLLKRDKTCRLGVANKRRKASWDFDYLLQVLSGGDTVTENASS